MKVTVASLTHISITMRLYVHIPRQWTLSTGLQPLMATEIKMKKFILALILATFVSSPVLAACNMAKDRTCDCSRYGGRAASEWLGGKSSYGY